MKLIILGVLGVFFALAASNPNKEKVIGPCLDPSGSAQQVCDTSPPSECSWWEFWC